MYKLILYADSVAIIVFHDEKETVEAELNREIEGVSEWFIDNKLALPQYLSLYYLVRVPKLKKRKSSRVEMKVGDMIIGSKQEVKYLGCVRHCSKVSGDNMAALIHMKIL